MRTSWFAAAVCVLSMFVSAPAAAQSLGAGVSFLGDERGPGFLVDYSSPLAKQSGGATLGWVGEFGFNHKGFGSNFAGVSGGVTTIMAQAGLRLSGAASSKVSWQAQGVAGIMRTSFGFDAAGTSKAVCDAFDIDCSASASDTGGVLTVGGGLQYAFSDTKALRGQLDFPIAIASDGGSTTRFAIMLVFKR